MSQSEAASERSPQYPGWRVVLVCFFVALFSWGFAFYGHGVYLAEFSRLYGWSASSISLASTFSYILSALLVVLVSDAVARLGARRFLLAGIGCLAASGALLAGVTQYWQLVAVYLLMAFGWAGLGVAAITNILGRSFRDKRGLAISLALNGASLSGVLFVPPLVAAAGYVSFSAAMLGASAIMLAVLLPLVLLCVPKETGAPVGAENGGVAVLQWSRTRALRDVRFWSVTTPFAFAITAQAGFLVHQIAYLSPVIGREPAALAVAVTTGFAVIGRVGLGFVIDRLDHRMASAASFLSQTFALGVMAVSDSTPVLLACCAVYGFSVGNLITFPALIIQREFAPASFGMLIGLSTAIGQFIYAFGPGLIGIVRDASGGYTAALLLCGLFNVIAAVIILMKPRFSGMVAPG